MQISRKKTRKFLLQKLYARIYGEFDQESFKESFFDGILDFNPDYDYLNEMYELFLQYEKEILSLIELYAPKFDIDTMLKTNILCMGIAMSEMLWLKEEIPGKVSINEAIELAKYFWDDTSKKIVNWILNSFYENISSHQNDAKKIESKHSLFA